MPIRNCISMILSTRGSAVLPAPLPAAPIAPRSTPMIICRHEDEPGDDERRHDHHRGQAQPAMKLIRPVAANIVCASSSIRNDPITPHAMRDEREGRRSPASIAAIRISDRE